MLLLQLMPGDCLISLQDTQYYTMCDYSNNYGYIESGTSSNAGSLSQCVQVLYACLCIRVVVDVNVHALCALHVLILNEH